MEEDMKKVFLGLILIFLISSFTFSEEDYILYIEAKEENPVFVYTAGTTTTWTKITEGIVIITGSVETDKFKIGTPYKVIYCSSEIDFRGCLISVRAENQLLELKMPGEIPNCVTFYKIDLIKDIESEYIAVYKQRIGEVGKYIEYDILHVKSGTVNKVLYFLSYSGGDEGRSSDTFFRFFNVDNDEDIEIEIIEWELNYSPIEIEEESIEHIIRIIRYDWDGKKYIKKIISESKLNEKIK